MPIRACVVPDRCGGALRNRLGWLHARLHRVHPRRAVVRPLPKARAGGSTRARSPSTSPTPARWAATPRGSGCTPPMTSPRGSASGSPSPWASRGRATSSTRSRCARPSGAWPRPPRTASPLVRPTSTSSTCTPPPPTSRRRSSAARGRPAARCRPSARRSRRSRATRSTSSIPRTTAASARATASDCAIVYLDTSRAATRRWCSMQRCGNRAKVRAHRARKAVQAAA